MKQSNTQNGRIIALKDLWNVFTQRFVIIALAALLVGSALFVYKKVTYKPMYSSTAIMYILRDNEKITTDSGVAANELNLSLRMVEDCIYLLKSRSVVDTVIDELDLKMGYGTLASRISAQNPENTRVLEVTVQTDNPEDAKRIVDKLCEVGQVRIEEAMGFKQVNFYEYGTLSYAPSNGTTSVTYLLAGGAAAAVCYLVFLVLFLLDDRIRSNSDIEQYLGLSVLGEIANADDEQKRRYGYYQGYGKYTGRFAAKDNAEQSSKNKRA